jgi:pimeloyl-ACP methyl ester carboxylesterase
VLVHGLWAAAWILESWLEPAADRGWDAWAPNLRGREGSRPVEDVGHIGMEDFAADLRDVLEHVGPSIVVGYSMGGLVAQMVATDAETRDLVRGLVLMCSVPPRGIVALSGSVLRASVRYVPAMMAGRAFRPTRAESDAMMMNDLPVAERERWFPRFILDAGRAARQMATGVATARAPLDAPVLVVSAEHDHISPPPVQRPLVRRYGAEHLPVAGRAHLIAIEPGWEAVESAILDRVEAW